MTNNIIDRSRTFFYRGDYGDNSPLTIYLQNNLFRGGEVEMRYDSQGTSDLFPTFWDVYDLSLIHI